MRGALNPRLEVEGVLLTMYDDRTNLGQLVARDVREFFKDKVFNTIIPRNVRLGEAPSHGIPCVIYDSHIVVVVSTLGSLIGHRYDCSRIGTRHRRFLHQYSIPVEADGLYVPKRRC